MLVATALTPFASCNSSEEVEVVLPSSATVRSFKLTANDKILPHLDSIFFSIDLYSGQIYNADSLPYGTRTSALVPVITTDGASVAQLTVPRDNKPDTIIDYLENSTDTVDFSNGPVKLRLVSLDGKTERNYTISVNVHQVPTDTLRWSRFEGGNLPSVFSVVSEQKTTEASGTYYCLTRYEHRYSMAWTTDPAGAWNAAEVSLPADADIYSLTATSDALYITDTTGALFTSADKGASWTPTGSVMNAIIGAYGDRLLGTARNASQWTIVDYPASRTWALPDGFPVSGTSTAVAFRFEMSSSPQLIFTGGRKADGQLSKATWSFDGSNWADITKKPIPYALENMALVPYFDIQPDTAAWRVSKRTSVMLAMNGNRADGSPNDTVYMSSDFGLHWTKAPDNLQMPVDVVPSRTRTQAFAYTATLRSRSASGNRVITWRDLGLARRPMSRATAPITEWDVPYIYLFGGISAEGHTYNTVFRGVITEFSFKPLQ